VLKPGGRAAFVAWGKKEQPFFTTTAGIVLKHVPVPPPPPDPDGPSMFMLASATGCGARWRSPLQHVHEEDRIIAGRWAASVEEYWSSSPKSPRPSARSSNNSRPKKWLRLKRKFMPPEKNSGTARN